jgi:tetratricopeptide (TPR) repeat protein
MSEIENILNQVVWLERKNDLAQALSLCENAIEKYPDSDRLLYLAGVLEDKRGESAKALFYFQQASIKNDTNPIIMLALQVKLFHLGEIEKSIKILSSIIEKYPKQFPLAYHNLGTVLDAKGDLEGAKKAFLEAISLDSQYNLSHYGLAFALGKQGDLQGCWKKMLDAFYRKSSGSPDKNIAWWQGEDLTGKTLLVYTNGGIGDYFQFFRYLERLVDKNIKVLLEGYPHSLVGDLIKRSLPSNVCFYTGKEIFDVPCLISHLGIICKTTVENIPNVVPYLKSHPHKLKEYSKFFAKDPNYKVGIVWKGNPLHKNDHHRSMTLQDFAPLWDVPGCTFYGLQKKHTDPIPNDIPFIDLSRKLRTFDDTAAIMSCLDLIIGVDTSVIHLAGALGIPVWTLLGFYSDYRWMLDREDTPWYPTMQLFRSEGSQKWGMLMQKVRSKLLEQSKSI